MGQRHRQPRQLQSQQHHGEWGQQRRLGGCRAGQGSQGSVTKAGVSGAGITLSGQDDSTALAGLNREAVTGTDTSGALTLKKVWVGQ